jgi:hypothetical protein
VVHELIALGLRTGREHAVALRPSGERVGPVVAGERHVVTLPDEAMVWMNRPGAELAICHNHPARRDEPPNELSPVDLLMLGRPGIRSIHMVSSYEPEGYSIATRTWEASPEAWARAVRCARDVADELVDEPAAVAYRAARGLRRLDSQRVLVRLLAEVGAIGWDRRFDGASRRFEWRHGAFLNQLAAEGCRRFQRRFGALDAGLPAHARAA